MSDGRLNIQVFGAVSFGCRRSKVLTAVRAGTVEMNHANSYFRDRQDLCRQYFTAVPSA